MAHPSPSPSGSSRRRRLSEVLGEQQEPFSLDLYLLERGCSPAFLDATLCGSGGACSTCWPNTRGTARTLRRPAGNKKGFRHSGVLRMLLSKILSGRTAPPATKNRQQRASIEWRWRRVAEKQRTPERFELAVHPASPRALEAHMEDDLEQEDDDEEESSKKQLSPVSVLEHRLFEHSPPPPHAPKSSLAIFGELLEAAYTHNTLLDDVLAIAKDRNSSTQSKDGRRRSSSSTDSSTPTTPLRARRRRRKKKHAHRKEGVALEKDLGRLTSLVASESEMAAWARVRAVDLRPSVEDVGVLIAAAVLEALTEETEETAAELMGMDRGCACAVDTTRRCGRW